MSAAELRQLAGEPTEVLDSWRKFQWQCYYDESYRSLLFAGVDNGTVVGLMAAGADASYCGAKIGELCSVQNGSRRYGSGSITVYVMRDQNNSNKMHAVQLLLTGYSAYPAEGFLDGESRVAFLLTNAFRSLHGIVPLKWDDEAGEVARNYSRTMAENNYVGHFGPDGSSPGDRLDAAGIEWSAYAENAAGGTVDGADSYNGWVNSAGHRANLLYDQVSRIGVGGYFKRTDTNVHFYWTQVFYDSWIW